MNGFVQDLRNAFRRGGRVLVQLIIINVIIFLGLNVLIVTLKLMSADSVGVLLSSQFELPADMSKLLYRPWTILSYAFWHGDIWHIAVNMLVMYWFGQIFEEYVGGKRLLSVYILSALAGGVCFILLYNFAPVPTWRKTLPTVTLLGASGAVYGVVLATATLLPNFSMYLFLIGPVQIKYLAAVYVILSYIGLGGWNAGGNMAHLGGALMGYVFTIQLQRGNDLGAWIHNFLDWVRRLFRPKPKVKVTHQTKEKATVNQTKAKTTNQTNKPQASIQDVPNQQEIDAILDKISATGYESLSKEEKQKLFKASNG